MRTLVDLFLDIEAGTGREIELVKECIEWAGNERRTFLRQALEAKLMGLLANNQLYEEALRLGKSDLFMRIYLAIVSDCKYAFSTLSVFQAVLFFRSWKSWMTKFFSSKCNSWRARYITVLATYKNRGQLSLLHVQPQTAFTVHHVFRPLWIYFQVRSYSIYYFVCLRTNYNFSTYLCACSITRVLQFEHEFSWILKNHNFKFNYIHSYWRCYFLK